MCRMYFSIVKGETDMNFDKIFDVIDELYEKNRSNNDWVQLTEDVYKAAIEYTNDRVKWNFYSREQKQENDNFRTTKHNSFIDRYNILLRYLGQTMDVSELKIEGDRKVLGDFANYIVYRLAVKQR